MWESDDQIAALDRGESKGRKNSYDSNQTEVLGSGLGW